MSEQIYKPTNLSECFEQLDKIFSESPDADDWKVEDERKAIASSHHGLGQWIRNNWELWKEESTLHQHFEKLGLHHADDMSGVILTSYHRHLNNKDLGLDEQINHYIDFWKKGEK